MTPEDRNTIAETVDILRALGGNNGFSNLRPKMKKLLLTQANKLNGILNSGSRSDGLEVVEFSGETVYA